MENNEKKFTAKELLVQFDEFYENYMENLNANLKRGAELSKYIFTKSHSEESLEKYLEYFFELNKTAVEMRENLEKKVQKITELEKQYFGGK